MVLEDILKDVIKKIPLMAGEIDILKEILKEHLGYNQTMDDLIEADIPIFEKMNQMIMLTYIHDQEMRDALTGFQPVGINGTGRVNNAGQPPIFQISFAGRPSTHMSVKR